MPAIPNIPLPSRPTKRASISVASDAKKSENASLSNSPRTTDTIETISQVNGEGLSVTAAPTVSPSTKAAPKSWADLVKTMAQPTSTSANKVLGNHNAQNNGFANAKTGSLADALSSFSINQGNDDSRTSFLEPRGLVNTGNMCYMNSVSRLSKSLLFCQYICR